MKIHRLLPEIICPVLLQSTYFGPSTPESNVILLNYYYINTPKIFFVAMLLLCYVIWRKCNYFAKEKWIEE